MSGDQKQKRRCDRGHLEDGSGVKEMEQSQLEEGVFDLCANCVPAESSISYWMLVNAVTFYYHMWGNKIDDPDDKFEYLESKPARRRHIFFSENGYFEEGCNPMEILCNYIRCSRSTRDSVYRAVNELAPMNKLFARNALVMLGLDSAYTLSDPFFMVFHPADFLAEKCYIMSNFPTDAWLVSRSCGEIEKRKFADNVMKCAYYGTYSYYSMMKTTRPETIPQFSDGRWSAYHDGFRVIADRIMERIPQTANNGNFMISDTDSPIPESLKPMFRIIISLLVWTDRMYVWRIVLSQLYDCPSRRMMAVKFVYRILGSPCSTSDHGGSFMWAVLMLGVWYLPYDANRGYKAAKKMFNEIMDIAVAALAPTRCCLEGALLVIKERQAKEASLGSDEDDLEPITPWIKQMLSK